MENSQQENEDGLSFCGMKKHSLLMISLLVSFFLVPVQAQGEPICEGSECSVSFSYTGEMQTWQVPDAAVNLRFEIYGASGARGGGGGLVSGSLVAIPSTLYLFVGGQGTEGANAPGGFNGGGAAGGNRGNEGSGGGATDIRIGLALQDRIVVAGGGGGAGGYAGAAGGAGGGLVGDSGGSGQGGGGEGGTESAGGNPGYSNGGSAASAGNFGTGGTGGTSWNAGGGGGGGGWYGGGGGGADDDSCCSDAGGGGGGSSYAATQYTNNIEHQRGVRTGDGLIVLSYSIPAQVLSFSGQQVDASTTVFSLELSQAILGLETDDFELIGAGCAISGIETADTIAEITLTGCADGEVALVLRALSIGDNNSAPLEEVVASATVDATPPEFAWLAQGGLLAQNELTAQFSVSDSLMLATSDFEVVGCSDVELNLSTVVASGCQEGEILLSLLPGVLSDAYGNTGPSSRISVAFNVDTQAPDAAWLDVAITGEGPFEYSAVLVPSDLELFDPAVVVFESDQDCLEESERVDGGWAFRAVCDYAAGKWTLPALSMLDLAGNQGPLLEKSIEFLYEPQPQEVEPPADPVTPVAQPIQPAPPADVAEDSPVIEEDPIEEESSEEPLENGQTEVIDEALEVELIQEVIEEVEAAPLPTSSPSPQPIEPEASPETFESGRSQSEESASPEPTAQESEEQDPIDEPLTSPAQPEQDAEQLALPVSNSENTEEPVGMSPAGLLWLLLLAGGGFVAWRLSGR